MKLMWICDKRSGVLLIIWNYQWSNHNILLQSGDMMKHSSTSKISHWFDYRKTVIHIRSLNDTIFPNKGRVPKKGKVWSLTNKGVWSYTKDTYINWWETIVGGKLKHRGGGLFVLFIILYHNLVLGILFYYDVVCNLLFCSVSSN